MLSDPLSRGPRYMSKFRDAARAMGATSFVRMPIPTLITSMLSDLAEISPRGRTRGEREQRGTRRKTTPITAVTEPESQPGADEAFTDAKRHGHHA